MDDRSKDVTGAENYSSTPYDRNGMAADIFRVLDDGCVEDDDMLRDMKARIRRSIDDPRPSLSVNQLDDFIGALVAKTRADTGRA